MSLPDAWVDRIFTKLSLVYGHQFLSRVPRATGGPAWGPSPQT